MSLGCGSRSGSGRPVCKGRYPPTRTDQQIIRWVASRQPNHQPPRMTHHSSRQTDDPKAHYLHPPAHPLTYQRQPLQRRVQVERQHRDCPPARSSFSTECTSSPLQHLCLYHHRFLCVNVTVGHHSTHLVPARVSHLHDTPRHLRLRLHSRQ